MPARAALNVVYALQVKEMDAKERADFDHRLNGWDRVDEKANKALWQGTPAPARPDSDGGESSW
jgi:hypothetical protein